MPLKTITFVRHAQSVSNAGGLTLPHHEIPLTNFGQRQALTLAGLLDVTPSKVVVSAMIRTHLTAQPFCERFGVKLEVDPGLNEFSMIDPALIQGMDGPQRKPFVKAYWDDPDRQKRMGQGADTFAEFEARVGAFMTTMDTLPEHTVLFGHGTWFGLMFWKMLGYDANSPEAMRAFRRCQQNMPMPNCAVFRLTWNTGGHWSVKAVPEIPKALLLV